MYFILHTQKKNYRFVKKELCKVLESSRHARSCINKLMMQELKLNFYHRKSNHIKKIIV